VGNALVERFPEDSPFSGAARSNKGAAGKTPRATRPREFAQRTICLLDKRRANSATPQERIGVPGPPLWPLFRMVTQGGEGRRGPRRKPGIERSSHRARCVQPRGFVQLPWIRGLCLLVLPLPLARMSVAGGVAVVAYLGQGETAPASCDVRRVPPVVAPTATLPRPPGASCGLGPLSASRGPLGLLGTRVEGERVSEAGSLRGRGQAAPPTGSAGRAAASNS
jgi:hypothetical protein